MTTTTIDQDRDSVRRLLLESEELIRKDADAANAKTAEMESISARWDQAGQLVELLSPLLADSEDRYVRFGAATYLLGHGHEDVAVPVLETVDVLEAEPVLRYWRRKQGSA